MKYVDFGPLKAAKTIADLLKVVSKMPDYFTIALAYGLARELQPQYDQEAVEALGSILYNSDFSEKSSLNILELHGAYADAENTGTITGTESMMMHAFAYVLGLEEGTWHYATSMDDMETIERVRKEIKKLVGKKATQSIEFSFIKLAVATATGWANESDSDGFPWRN